MANKEGLSLSEVERIYDSLPVENQRLAGIVGCFYASRFVHSLSSLVIETFKSPASVAGENISKYERKDLI